MNTVNVLEMTDETNILSLRSWEDNQDGNKEAEDIFVECMLENEDILPAGTATVQACIESGLYEVGDYKLFLIHSTGTKMGNKNLPTECDTSTRSTSVIYAEVHTDTRCIEIEFDALEWLKQAKTEALANLATCGWRGDYPADEVAIFMADHDKDVAFLFKYLEISSHRKNEGSEGFECSINGEHVMAWLKENEPKVHTAIKECIEAKKVKENE